jgi:hypothetical protein
MSIKGIFGLFGLPDDDNVGDNYSSSMDVFKETPHFKVGMFCKMIKNGKNFTKQLLGFFKTSNDPINLSGVDEASEIMMYNRAFSWIQECDLNNDDWKLALHNHKEKGIIECLVGSIKYFESIEEYEICAFLKKLQNFTEEIYP